MLEQIAAQAAAAVLNHLLAREARARDELAPYAGRSLRLQAAPFSVQLGIVAGGTFAADSGTPTVTVGVDASALPQWLLDPKSTLRNVRLEGDAEFAQTLSQVLGKLRPEPEEELSRLVGDAAAVRIVALLRAALGDAREAGSRLASSAADYLVAENPMLVGRAEFAQFTAQVTALRDDVERLGARLSRIR